MSSLSVTYGCFQAVSVSLMAREVVCSGKTSFLIVIVSYADNDWGHQSEILPPSDGGAAKMASGAMVLQAHERGPGECYRRAIDGSDNL